MRTSRWGGWVFQFLPGIGKSITTWLSSYGGYLHGGNMRYLTNCPGGQYSNVRLLYSVSILFRIKGLVTKKLPWKKFVADHSIRVYRKKLAVIAERNNLKG